MITLAIDPSIVKTGWCIFIDGKYKYSGMIKTKRDKNLTKAQNLNNRMKFLYDNIIKIIPGDMVVNQVVIEDQFLKVNVDAMKTLICARAALSINFINNNIPVYYITPSEWQCSIFGKKSKETKVDSIKYAAEFKTGITDDEADAINICNYFTKKS
jgi:Holliday junction resolvasome RuvABC endonuclease subunit